MYHGTKLWKSGMILRAPCINYHIERNQSIEESIVHAKGLLVQLNDFENLPLLDKSMYNAQTFGAFSPFVSTTLDRKTAINFALENDNPGYILTIKGPEDAFYNFNRIREIHNLPKSPVSHWMKEMGIPLEIELPFKVIQVDHITGQEEKKECVFKSD